MELCIFMLGISGIVMAFIEGTKLLAVILGLIAFSLAVFEFYNKNKKYEPLSSYNVYGILLGLISTVTSVFLLFW